MNSPITGTSTTDKLSDINHEPLAEVQSQINKVSPSKERTEEDALSKPLDQESKETSSNGDDALDLNPRVRYVRSEVDDKGDRHERPGKRTITTNSTSKEDSNIAFIVKDFWTKDNVREKTDIVLKGQDLRRIIYHVIGKHLEHNQNRNWLAQEQTIDEAVNEIWYWNELSEAAKSNWGSEQGRQDLQALLDHLSEIKMETVKLVKSISSMTRVPIKDLWCLFRPGTLVISKPFLDEPQLFRVHKCDYKERDDEKTFLVQVWAFSWTGTELIQEYYNFTITENQEVMITDLPCYPVQYYRNSDGIYGPEAVKALQTDLIARGRLFRDLCRESVDGSQHTYDGELLTDDVVLYSSRHEMLYTLQPDSYFHPRLDIKGDIMIDFTAYKRYSRRGVNAIGSLFPAHIAACKCQLCFDRKSNCIQWMRRFAEKAAGNDSADEASNYLLLPARLLGYCFKTKVWAQFHVYRIGTIEAPDVDNLMKKLIFPEESESTKQDLKILIEQHGTTKLHLVEDSIKGKGAGLIVLLHGPPGVGKTLTAETLAKCASKPLYVLGASDISSTPSIAEAILMRAFELVERWSAVLLIDEADVFIDSRGTKGEADLSKNALVSVMLRVLEYFKGILIMTTNRVMTFDVAMLSRCHFAVHFKSLTLEQEKRIWKSYLGQLTDQNSSRRPEIEAWVKQITKKRTKLSGREIRNLFTTAQTLAQDEPNKKIMKKHLECAYDRLIEFLDAMEKNKNTQQALLNASYS